MIDTADLLKYQSSTHSAGASAYRLAPDARTAGEAALNIAAYIWPDGGVAPRQPNIIPMHGQHDSQTPRVYPGIRTLSLDELLNVALGAYLGDRVVVEPCHHGAIQESASLDLYVHLIAAIDEVQAVYADNTHGLTVYTVYVGDRRALRERLYDIYDRVMDEFPDLVIDFRILDAARLGAVPVPTTAREVFVRQ